MSKKHSNSPKTIEGEVIGPEDQEEVFEELQEDYLEGTFVSHQDEDSDKNTESEQIEILEDLLPAQVVMRAVPDVEADHCCPAPP